MENKDKNRFGAGLLTGLLLAALVIGAIITGQKVIRLFRMNGQITEDASVDSVNNPRTMKKLELIESIIDENYALDMVDEKSLEEGVYKGLVDALGDDYSMYFSAEEMQQQQLKMNGTYYGIGCYVMYDTQMDFARLGEIFAGSPAEECGLQEGDYIIKVDDTYTKGMELGEIVDLIKGEEGTKVHLTIMREGEPDFLEIDAERREVPKQTVEYKMLDDHIAYIQIKEFDTITTDQFADALATAKGNHMLGLILDLRNNPGGSLAAVTEIARKLLPEGIIVYTEDKAGNRKDYNCDGENELTVPMAVLVNGGSASASEILAGAIKDYEKGTLIGTTTFGKGIVQNYVSLTDGSAIKLTVSKYYTPNGNNIHGIGIEPDEELELDYDKFYTEGIDNQLERAKELLTTGE